jgi:hypothetical protein
MPLTKNNPTKKDDKLYGRDRFYNPIYQKIPKYKFGPLYIIANLDDFEIINQGPHSDCVACVMKFIAEYYDYNNIKSIINVKPTTNATPTINAKKNISIYSLYYEARFNDEIGPSNDYLDMGTTVYAGLYALSNGFTLESSQPGQTDEEIWKNTKIPKSSYVLEPAKDYSLKPRYKLDLTYGTNLFSVKRIISDVKYYLYFNLPIVFSLKFNTLDKSFESLGSDVYKPKPLNSKYYAIHCLIIVGYDDNKNAFLCRNSYGKNYGINGYFYMDYSFLTYKDNTIKEFLMDDMFVII